MDFSKGWAKLRLRRPDAGSGQAAPRVVAPAGVARACSIPGCRVPATAHDPAVGYPLCDDHHRLWRAQEVAWQS
jgi:hypothetical protein